MAPLRSAANAPGWEQGAEVRLLLVVVGALGACLLWGLVVRWWDRRQSRVDLVALEERLQAERARGRAVEGVTDRDLDAARRAFYRTDEPPDHHRA